VQALLRRRERVDDFRHGEKDFRGDGLRLILDPALYIEINDCLTESLLMRADIETRPTVIGSREIEFVGIAELARRDVKRKRAEVRMMFADESVARNYVETAITRPSKK
jgi:hypothetical protein